MYASHTCVSLLLTFVWVVSSGLEVQSRGAVLLLATRLQHDAHVRQTSYLQYTEHSEKSDEK